MSSLGLSEVLGYGVGLRDTAFCTQGQAATEVVSLGLSFLSPWYYFCWFQWGCKPMVEEASPQWRLQRSPFQSY